MFVQNLFTWHTVNAFLFIFWHNVIFADFFEFAPAFSVICPECSDDRLLHFCIFSVHAEYASGLLEGHTKILYVYIKSASLFWEFY